jgi:cell division protease FtsH
MEKSKRVSGVVVAVVVAALIMAIILPLTASPNSTSAAPLNEVIGAARAGAIERVIVTPGESATTVIYRDGTQRQTHIEPNSTVLEYFQLAGVPADRIPAIEVRPASGASNWLGAMAGFLPIMMLGGILLIAFMFMRQNQQSDPQANSFGKSRARVFRSDKPTTIFEDVAGVEEAKQELEEVVAFLRSPEKFTALGARVPRGVLLVGPPGTGKTLMARAVAGEARVCFFHISGSEFVEMFVGVGASRVRDLFDQAKKSAPAIIFIDEIDAVGRQRGAGLGGGHDEREQTLNQILVEMDGFDSRTNVIVIAATNRPDILDPALLRPGRFDRRVTLDRPDINGRRSILDVHTRGKPLARDVDVEVLAKQTAGFSGADLANLVNEAAILAARRDDTIITLNDFEDAVDRVVAGPERKSRLISDHERRVTAYHEMGHALVARVLPTVDPVHKVSIVARGSMGGYTRLLPTEDRYLWTRAQFLDTLAWALGGFVAEELIFGDVTTGASNDIERSTGLARKMVCEFGMSASLGPVAFGRREDMMFLGRELGGQSEYGPDTAREIDGEIRTLMTDAYKRAKEILVAHRDRLVRISEILVERETLEGEELERLFELPHTKISPLRGRPALEVAATEVNENSQPAGANHAAISYVAVDSYRWHK